MLCSEDDVTAVYKISGEDKNGGLQKYKKMLERDIWSIEDWHEQIQINQEPNVEDIATEYKPARRVRFTLDYVKAHEDPEDGALLKEA